MAEEVVRRRPAVAASLAAVGATVCAVVATLTIPHLVSAQAQSGPGVPRLPAPTQAAEAPGTRTWQTVSCPSHADTCAAPDTLDHAGLLLFRAGEDSLVLHSPPTASSLTLRLPASKLPRWVLVGVERAGADSQVVIMLGQAPAVTVPVSRLSLFPLSSHGPTVVTVADDGKPREGEVLRVVEYTHR